MMQKISHRMQAIIDNFYNKGMRVVSIEGIGAKYKVFGYYKNSMVEPKAFVKLVSRKEATEMLINQEK